MGRIRCHLRSLEAIRRHGYDLYGERDPLRVFYWRWPYSRGDRNPRHCWKVSNYRNNRTSEAWLLAQVDRHGTPRDPVVGHPDDRGRVPVAALDTLQHELEGRRELDDRPGLSQRHAARLSDVLRVRRDERCRDHRRPGVRP